MGLKVTILFSINVTAFYSVFILYHPLPHSKWEDLEKLLKAQEDQEKKYNKSICISEFQPGNSVVLLLPTSESKLLAQWQGPFEIVRLMRTVDYKVCHPGKRKAIQIYHVNLWKVWKE